MVVFLLGCKGGGAPSDRGSAHLRGPGGHAWQPRGQRQPGRVVSGDPKEEVGDGTKRHIGDAGRH